MSLVLLFHYLLLNMFRMLVHPSSGACESLWIYFLCCISLALLFHQGALFINPSDPKTPYKSYVYWTVHHLDS